MHMIKLVLIILIFIFSALVVYLKLDKPQNTTISPNFVTDIINPSPSPKTLLQTPPESKILPNDYHVFQSFNNCGPAAMSMALSYYGINESQQKLGQELRPYQVPGGDNDDKSVTLEELAEKSKEYGLVPYHRPNGNIDLIKQFISYDIPVITRTWLKVNDDIGHYRVIKGYVGDTIIQDDSLQGKNLKYSAQEFNDIWKKFNYEYLVLVPQEKQEIANAILGEDVDPKVAWQKALRQAQGIIQENPNDIDARFNLSVAYYNVGDFQKSVEEFEKVESQLPFRTLWYQIEPILAYYELGMYDRVFEITDRVLNYHNRAFSELYFIRGNIYLKQGNTNAAQQEFQKAVLYNQNFSSKIPQF